MQKLQNQQQNRKLQFKFDDASISKWVRVPRVPTKANAVKNLGPHASLNKRNYAKTRL